MSAPMMPCEISPDCLHVTCHVCDRPIRGSNTNGADHPGSVIGRIRSRLCFRDLNNGHPASEQPSTAIRYYGDQLLTYHELERIRRTHPGMYAWHMWRRSEKAKEKSQA